MKMIPVRYRGHVVAHALVDDQDFDRLSAFRWSLSGYGHWHRFNRDVPREQWLSQDEIWERLVDEGTTA